MSENRTTFSRSVAVLTIPIHAPLLKRDLHPYYIDNKYILWISNILLPISGSSLVQIDLVKMVSNRYPRCWVLDSSCLCSDILAKCIFLSIALHFVWVNLRLNDWNNLFDDSHDKNEQDILIIAWTCKIKETETWTCRKQEDFFFRYWSKNVFFHLNSNETPIR